MEFVINLTNEALVKVTDSNGVRTGKKRDKFAESFLTKVPASHTNTVMIAESPVNIECKVKQIIPLGSHDMFIAEVVAVHVNEDLINPQTDNLRLDKAKLIAYSHGYYFLLEKNLGKFGFSVRRKKKAKNKKRKK